MDIDDTFRYVVLGGAVFIVAAALITPKPAPKETRAKTFMGKLRKEALAAEPTPESLVKRAGDGLYR